MEWYTSRRNGKVAVNRHAVGGQDEHRPKVSKSYKTHSIDDLYCETYTPSAPVAGRFKDDTFKDTPADEYMSESDYRDLLHAFAWKRLQEFFGKSRNCVFDSVVLYGFDIIGFCNNLGFKTVLVYTSLMQLCSNLLARKYKSWHAGDIHPIHDTVRGDERTIRGDRPCRSRRVRAGVAHHPLHVYGPA